MVSKNMETIRNSKTIEQLYFINNFNTFSAFFSISTILFKFFEFSKKKELWFVNFFLSFSGSVLQAKQKRSPIQTIWLLMHRRKWDFMVFVFYLWV